eukprot:scaffold567_cov99-Skeletonema_dohrnii-CCMP3373.AAC.1
MAATHLCRLAGGLAWSKFWLGLMAENVSQGDSQTSYSTHGTLGKYHGLKAAIHFANDINKDERKRFDRVIRRHILAQHSKYLA